MNAWVDVAAKHCVSTFAQIRAAKKYTFFDSEMLLLKETIMDKDRVAGSAKEIKGTIKQAVGQAIGDALLLNRTKCSTLTWINLAGRKE